MKITSEKIRSMKGKEKISALTAYDYATAKILDEAGLDIVLVGDSLGMVLYGFENTQKVTMQHMLMHTNAVASGCKKALIVGDMPYKSYDTPKKAIENAKLFLKAGADTVKTESRPDIVEALTKENIGVMGHIGLTPQTITDFKVQGRDEESAKRLLEEAKTIEKAGAYCLVLECVPNELAKKITESIKIPTIGIGAGPYCDGQVLVINDILGLYDRLKPRFVKRYAELWPTIKNAVSQYKRDVKEKTFPTEEMGFK